MTHGYSARSRTTPVLASFKTNGHVPVFSRPTPSRDLHIYIYYNIHIYTHTIYIYTCTSRPTPQVQPPQLPQPAAPFFFPPRLTRSTGGLTLFFFFNLAGTRTTTRSTGRFTSRSRNWIKRVWRLLKVSIPRPLLSIRFIFFNFFNFF
jgi:hypothetical protein